MSDQNEKAANLAIFCDFENVAIGVKESRYQSFDIQLVLERLLDKGNIVVKKAYADWGRFKNALRPLHEAAFELIEIPHVSYSGKNSADIRLVVDALDLCYTKQHVDVFVIVSGDSDFSPLVSKLRENNKKVIGLGVKNSSSDLLIENCDEFILYDDLIRASGTKRTSARRKSGRRGDRRPAPAGTGPSANETASSPSRGASTGNSNAAPTAPGAATEGGEQRGAAQQPPVEPKAPGSLKSEAERKKEALEMVLDTVDSLFRERDGNLWGSMVKQTITRKRPTFNESFHGYSNFSQLLLDARTKGLLEIQKDSKSGGYLILGFGPEA